MSIRSDAFFGEGVGMAAGYLSIVIPETPEERALVGRIYAAAARELLGEAGSSAVTPADPSVTGGASTNGPDGPSASPYDGQNGPDNLRRYIGELQSSVGARRFLRQVAVDCIEHGDSHARSLRQALGGVGAPVLAGWIAAIVGASRRLRWPKPYSQQWASGPQGGENVYRMPRDRARAITQLIDGDGQPTF